MELNDYKNLVSIDFNEAKTYPLKSRPCKVSVEQFGKVTGAEAAVKFSDFLESLPQIQQAKDFTDFCSLCSDSIKESKKITAAIGGHVIKTGVTPFLIDMIKKGLIGMISMNGSAAIHDFEIALNGKTSEDVASALIDGSFGMAHETGFYINDSFNNALKNNTGAGYEIYRTIENLNAPYKEKSLIYNAYKNGVPATVHIAVGTDIIHVHPNASGAAIGAASFNDFKLYCGGISGLTPGSVYMNIGSAVVMPEVFLKALTAVRNIGYDVKGFHTANFDMINQYRPHTNVLSRPTIGSGGRSFNFIGVHEIMIPLFYYSLMDRLNRA